MKKLIEIAMVIAIFSASTAAFAQNEKGKSPAKKQTNTSAYTSSQGSSAQKPAVTNNEGADLSSANAEIAAGMEKMRTDFNPLND